MSDLRGKIERISPYTTELGEGPHYDESTDRLYHVDIIKGGCYYLDTKTGSYESLQFESGLSLIVPIAGKENKFIISQNQSLVELDWPTKQLKPIVSVDDGKDTRVNDGKCDPNGRLWFGTMGWERKPGQFPRNLGSLYTLDSDGQVSLKHANVSISNGLAWSSDNRKFFYIDSIERQVWVYDYDLQTGDISNRKICCDFNDQPGYENEVPDGMTIDLNDKLWVASFNGSKITRFDPETGKALGVIETPASKTTSVTWGGNDFRTLYVTSAYLNASTDQLAAQPNAGAVFKVTFEQENIRGSINHSFKSN